ncbi:MAG: DUF4416 family protein [Candidatus Omnitrophica bacterium]|nr:DUF4416 family protein [Candidatus Omnitrophota bacterium]
MAKAKKHPKVNLIIGIIANKENLFGNIKKYLVRKFGEIDFESHVIDFNFTTYYEGEMGKNLKRRFLSFKNLIAPQELSDIKLYTNKLEERFSRSKNKPSRNINLDPGYVTSAKLVLVTAKDYFHRIYLNRGIFAEITLFFKEGSFQPFNWTYPDYKTKEYIDIFNQIRNLYIKKSYE